MPLKVRKIVKHAEEFRREIGRDLENPMTMIALAAVIENPWAGQGYVENLRPTILEVAPQLGELLVKRLNAEAGGGDAVQAYGKAAIVGVNGEIEQGSALIHTLRFGNIFRDSVGGTSYLSFTNTRGGPGCLMSIPMMHKHDEGLRSHYLTLDFTITDAPGPDEIIVALGAATGGRAFPRIGNRYSDMEEMGLTSKAGN